MKCPNCQSLLVFQETIHNTNDSIDVYRCPNRKCSGWVETYPAKAAPTEKTKRGPGLPHKRRK